MNLRNPEHAARVLAHQERQAPMLTKAEALAICYELDFKIDPDGDLSTLDTAILKLRHFCDWDEQLANSAPLDVDPQDVADGLERAQIAQACADLQAGHLDHADIADFVDRGWLIPGVDVGDERGQVVDGVCPHGFVLAR